MDSNTEQTLSSDNNQEAQIQDVNLNPSPLKQNQPQNEATMNEEQKGESIEYHQKDELVYPPALKSSNIPQPEEVKNYLSHLLTSDPYNKFCVDCHHNLATFACLTYGIFVCANCANVHKITFGGRSRSNIKEVFTEHWDDFQLEAISPGYGGNKAFFNFLQEYNIHSLPIDRKYKSDQVSYYVRRLSAISDRRAFNEQPPAKDWDERYERAKSSVLNLLNKSEKKISQMGEKIDRDIEQKGWKTKISGYFKDKFKKKDKSLSTGSIGDAVGKEAEKKETEEEINVYERDLANSEQQPVLLAEDSQGDDKEELGLRDEKHEAVAPQHHSSNQQEDKKSIE